MVVTLYRHPFYEANGASVSRYVAVAENEWFEVPGTPSGGWRLRRPYFGPKSGLLPVAEPMASELRRAFDVPLYPECRSVRSGMGARSDGRMLSV